MPFGDGTGPWGEGPMTGRGLGNCTTGPVTPAGVGRGNEHLADVIEEPQSDRPWPEEKVWVDD